MELKQYDILWILFLVDVGINVAGIFISVIFKVRLWRSLFDLLKDEGVCQKSQYFRFYKLLPSWYGFDSDKGVLQIFTDSRM